MNVVQIHDDLEGGQFRMRVKRLNPETVHLADAQLLSGALAVSVQVTPVGHKRVLSVVFPFKDSGDTIVEDDQRVRIRGVLGDITLPRQKRVHLQRREGCAPCPTLRRRSVVALDFVTTERPIVEDDTF